MEEKYEPENVRLNTTEQKFLGVRFVSTFGMRRVVIPDAPTRFSKFFAFVLVQTRIAHYACRENQHSGNAYSWTNALDIFSW